jgi:hypothetical protein
MTGEPLDRTWVEEVVGLPDYSTDADAIPLLQVLVEKGYSWKIQYLPDGFIAGTIFKSDYIIGQKTEPTIHEAVTDAVLQVIKKEVQDVM